MKLKGEKPKRIQLKEKKLKDGTSQMLKYHML
jgi:hypothetical protein